MTRQEKINTVLEAIETLNNEGFFQMNLKGRSGMRKSVSAKHHPLIRYVHRMVEFYGGLNYHMPTTTQFYLQDFVDMVVTNDKNDPERLTVYITSGEVKKLYEALDGIAKEMCLCFGLDPDAATKRWQKAFYG